MPFPSYAAGRVEARCDPAVDVLGVVQTLAGKRKSVPPLPPSMTDLARELEDEAGHPAVAAYAAHAGRVGEDDPWPVILTALSAPPELAWRRPPRSLSPDFVEKAGGPGDIEAFLSHLRDFAARPAVAAWLKRHAGECRGAEGFAARELGGRDPLLSIEDYLGVRLDAAVKLTITLIYTRSRYTSFIYPYPYSGRGERVKGPFEVRHQLKMEWHEGRRARFSLEAPFQPGIFQEVYYIAAEPAYERHKALFDERRGLRAGLEGCLPGWHDCALFIVTQALNRRVAAKDGKGLPEHGDDPVGRAIRRLADALEADYEPGRAAGRYRSIDDFWPRLIAALGPADAPAPTR